LETDDVDLDNEPQYNSRFHAKLNRRQLFEMTLSISPKLKAAYFLKEEYRRFNRVMSYEEALENVLQQAKHYELPVLSFQELSTEINIQPLGRLKL